MHNSKTDFSLSHNSCSYMLTNGLGMYYTQYRKLYKLLLQQLVFKTCQMPMSDWVVIKWLHLSCWISQQPVVQQHTTSQVACEVGHGYHGAENSQHQLIHLDVLNFDGGLAQYFVAPHHPLPSTTPTLHRPLPSTLWKFFWNGLHQ